MLRLNVGVLRLLVVPPVAIVVLAAAPLARAGTPGTLAQLASLHDCIQDTSVSEGPCPNSTPAPGLSGATDVTVSPDGRNVYVLASGRKIRRHSDVVSATDVDFTGVDA